MGRTRITAAPTGNYLIQLRVLLEYEQHPWESERMTETKAAVLTPGEWRDWYLSRYPLVSDDLSKGSWREHRERGLTRKYVEVGPKAFVPAIVIDVDHPNAALKAFERPRDHPTPSWVVVGPTGHAHVGWRLKVPVVRTDAGRVAPLRKLHRTSEGLRKCLDGDPAYVGLLTRNPLADGAEVIWGDARSYTLGDLHTPLAPKQLPRRPDRANGLGRNVSMFDTARHEVYGLHDPEQPFEDWHRIVLQHCHAVNTMFDDALGGPLPFAEVQATASSISRWVRRNLTMNKREWHAEQGRRGGIKSGQNRRAATASLFAEAMGL